MYGGNQIPKNIPPPKNTTIIKINLKNIFLPFLNFKTNKNKITTTEKVIKNFKRENSSGNVPIFFSLLRFPCVLIV